MSRREDIENTIWTDPDFEALSPYATLLYIWSFTNLRCGMAGVYKVSERSMAESKVPAKQIPRALAELEAARFAFYEEGVLWVRTRVKHLHTRTTQMAKSVANDLAKLPATHPLRERFIVEYGGSKWLRDALKGGLGEVHLNLSESPESKPDQVNLTGTSGEVPGLGEGLRQGKDLKQDDARARNAGLPADFPDELLPHLAAVVPVLQDLASRHNAKAVTRLSVANVIAARPRKPLVRCARDFASWADGKAQKRKDVVAGYRNWLDTTDELASAEAIGRARSSSTDFVDLLPFNRQMAEQGGAA